MESFSTHTDYDVVGRVVFDPEPSNPLDDWDHAWQLIADSRCPFTLDERGRGVHAGFGCDFRDSSDIRAERSAGDIVVLLRADEYGHGGRIDRTDSIDDCNAIARLDRNVLDFEWSGDRAAAVRYLDGILESLNSFYAGEVYGFVVDTPDEAQVDSCWGFVGDVDYVSDEMRLAVSHVATDRRFAALTRGLSTQAPFQLAF